MRSYLIEQDALIVLGEFPFLIERDDLRPFPIEEVITAF